MSKLQIYLLLLFTMFFVVAAQAHTTRVLELQMNEGSGSATLDVTAYSNDGLLVDQDTQGTIYWSADGDGYSGQTGDYCVLLDNEHDIILINDDPTLRVTGEFIVDIWFKPVGDIVMYGDREGFTRAYGVFGKGFNNGGTHEGYGMYIANNGILHGLIAFENAGLRDIASSANMDGTVLHSQWNHAIMTFDGVDTYGLWLNGVQLAIDGGSTLPSADLAKVSNRNLLIGIDEWNGSYFNGFVDEVKIDSDISALPAPSKTTVLYLRMNEGSGSGTLDSTSYANDGGLVDQDIQGTIYWSADGDGYSGRAGDYGIILDNGTDFIRVEDDPTVQLSGEFEITVWFKPVGDVVIYGSREGFTRAYGIFGKGFNNSGTHEGFGMYIANNGILHGLIAFENAGLKDIASSSNMDGTVRHSQWNRATFWFDGIDTYGLKLNGVQLNIDGGNTLPAADTIKVSNRDLFIGVDEWNGSYFNGVVDEIKIDRDISGLSVPNKLLELNMNEGSGTTTADTSGNNNDGTLVDQDTQGTIYWSADGDGYSGRAGDYGIILNNGTDFIRVEDDPTVQLSGEFEITVWFKPVGDVVIYGSREGFTRAYGIFGKGFNNSGTHEGFGMYIANNGILHGLIAFENAGLKDIASSSNMDGTVRHSQWNRATLWFDGIDTYGLKLNGVQLNIDGGSTLPAADVVKASNRDLFIGVDEWNGSYFNGYVDAFEIVAPQVPDLLCEDLTADISGLDGIADCIVDYFDIKAMALQWLDCDSNHPDCP